ncbi:MAG: hypothetical protein JKY70_10680 [Mucilaginibacter sp.]|nr:hypothetical protein [Mucilaginibacter sp.]
MLKKIWRWLSGISDNIKNSLNFGKEVANNIKTVADSSLLDIIVNLTPTQLDDIALASFRNYMNNVVTKLNWSNKMITETGDDEKAIILHTLSAVAAFWKAEHEQIRLSLQTTLSTAQLIYDESKVDLKV